MGCAPAGSIIVEGDDPAFDRGKSYLKVGRNKEAVDSFISYQKGNQGAKIAFGAGRLLLTLDRKDPVAAIYHFRRLITSA